MNMNRTIPVTDDPGEIIPPSLAIKAMRDSGYKNTAFALAELIDNSIQASADMIEIFCIERRDLVNQRERRRLAQIGVLDNGSGMDASTLRLALQFGNGTHLHDRQGIGRFGMGLPNASISQCRRVDIWSWQAGPDNAMHTYLAIDEIEGGKTRVVPEPQAKPLPTEWRDKSRAIGTTGTLVVWSNFEDHRLTWKTAKVTLEHTENLVGRIYRKFIHQGKATIRLVALENDAITLKDEEAKVNDPMYLMAPSSTPAPFHDKPMFQPWGDGSDMSFPIELEGEIHNVVVRMSWARPETVPEDGTDRGSKLYGKHAAKNIGVSIVRADRELGLDDSWANSYDPRERWWGIEVDFPPALDEVFGVTNNKQAATVFPHMAHFDWEAEKEAGESYLDFKRRLQEEGDTRYLLIDIVDYIQQQLKNIRKSIQDQTKGRRSDGRRHEDVSPEDMATSTWKERAKRGYKIAGDDEQLDEQAKEQLIEDLKNKRYEEREAREIANAVLHRQRKVIFVSVNADSQAFFSIEVKPGGITEVVFNMQHPVYEKLIKVLDDNFAEDSLDDLTQRVQDAADVLKLLFAAWARYEEEDVPNQESIRDVRHEWGKMAKNFLKDVN